MSETQRRPPASTEEPPGPKPPKPDPEQKPETFTQADVDRIVRERVQRERGKYADYDDLKTKAEGAKTLEDRVADIEQQAKASEARALRAELASAAGPHPRAGQAS